MSGCKSGQDTFLDAHSLHVVDTSRAKDGVWLVKVPNYLAELWQNAGSDGNVGKVVIASASGSTGVTPGGKKPGSQVTLVTDNCLLSKSGEEGKLIPKEHQFLIQTSNSMATAPGKPGQGGPGGTARRSGVMQGQELIILCEEDTNLIDNSGLSTLASSASGSGVNAGMPVSGGGGKRLSLFGQVNSRAECRPPTNARYMKLKAQQMKERNKPKYEVQLLDAAPCNYKPVSNHLANLEYDSKKRLEGKNMRREREDVMQDLFKAFERHQYYAIKDLVLLTKQPVTYLSEILKEIATFNSRPPHKNMWELKPEYRHYRENEGEKSDQPPGGGSGGGAGGGGSSDKISNSANPTSSST